VEIIIYDGTFEGWLTAVFEIYEHKFIETHITIKERLQPGFFGTMHIIITDNKKASRVWKGLQNKLSKAAPGQLYAAFLSEIKGIENTLLKYVQYIFKNKLTVERNYSNETILCVAQTAKKVHREKHRMEAFIRFQLTKDRMYYAICQPDFNVLPLIEKHFKTRYADQRWLIYDAGRKYGLYYDLNNVEMVQLSFNEQNNNGKNISAIYDESEILYQQLWQQYFASVNIASRKNTKLHIQHMPKRYWKFLPEKH
jgi:probable DNA metabolism protein